LTKEKLAEIEPTGIFVCGGWTPAYYDALCADKSWLAFLTENEISYCGFSAGASIAAAKAIIGGWRRKINEQTIEITNETAGEDLDFLDVRQGLGLVSFAVDVHTTQWGTLSRLVHTIDAESAGEGWAIDENTMLEISEKNFFVYGIGNAYRVRRRNERISIDIFQSGTQTF
jgi:cyanophycinase